MSSADIDEDEEEDVVGRVLSVESFREGASKAALK